ncbi:hypothetical protein HZH68_002900 [Vespula germanica]|uniref:Uncharacterized protein n=1 Tax=Vespula germanica TaxID=30212 RepID=A0A834NN35_VESGE|nr:hypothetical protein HZH68_002900 [Vespula germanica]
MPPRVWRARPQHLAPGKPGHTSSALEELGYVGPRLLAPRTAVSSLLGPRRTEAGLRRAQDSQVTPARSPESRAMPCIIFWVPEE